MVIKEKPKTRENYYFLPVLSFAFLAVSLLFYATDSLAQNIKFENLTIKRTDKAFEVSGTVVGTNLNPKGQVCEFDDVDIIAEIKEGPSSKYPILPEWQNIGLGCAAKGKRCLTAEEVNGIGIKELVISHFSLRPRWVYKMKNPPSTKRARFEGTIPLKYAGKRTRIRATLTHSWGGPNSSWPAITYHHAIGYEGILKRLQNVPSTGKGEVCKNPRLNADDDGDGVPNWRDLCPYIKASPKLRSAAQLGCPNWNIINEKLKIKSEAILRNQVANFLQCAGIPNANNIASQIEFRYTGGNLEFRYNSLLGTTYIEAGNILDWKSYWLKEMKYKCTGEKQVDSRYGDIYHELGHYFAHIFGVDDVAGSGEAHDTWKPSNLGTALDEGRADFTMLTMMWYLNRSAEEEKDYTVQTVRSRLASQPNDIGNKTEGAITTFFVELLNARKHPCEAFRRFYDAHAAFKHWNGRSPQNVNDLIIGYLLTIRDPNKRLKIDQYLHRYLLKRYHISTNSGYIDQLRDKYSIIDYNLVKDVNGYRKKLRISAMPNYVRAKGKNIDVEITKGFLGNNVFHVSPHKTDYEIIISDDHHITVKVNRGAVTVRPPGGSVVVIKRGESYVWPARKTMEPLRTRACTSLSLAANAWDQERHRHGYYTSTPYGLLIKGGAWTNGTLVNDRVDGNYLLSRKTFDFSKGGDVYMTIVVHGGGKYMGVYATGITEVTDTLYFHMGPNITDIKIPWLTTQSSWAGSTVIPDDELLFVHLHIAPDRTYSWSVCRGNYEDRGGQIIAKSNGTISEGHWGWFRKARVPIYFLDNYAGTDAYVIVKEARVCTGGRGPSYVSPPWFNREVKRLTLVPCLQARHRCYWGGGNLTFSWGRIEINSSGQVRVILRGVKGVTATETHPPYRLQVFYLGVKPSVAIGDPFYTDNEGNFDGIIGRISIPGKGSFVINSSGTDGNCKTYNTGARQQFITEPYESIAKEQATKPRNHTFSGSAQRKETSVMGPMEWDTDRMGLDYSNFDLPEANPALCRDACARDPKCKAWTYVKPNTIQGPKPRCWLKYAVPKPSHSTCCVSGVKH